MSGQSDVDLGTFSPDAIFVAYGWLLGEMLLQLAFAFPREENSDESTFLNTLHSRVQHIKNPEAREAANRLLAATELALKTSVDWARARESAVDKAAAEWQRAKRKGQLPGA